MRPALALIAGIALLALGTCSSTVQKAPAQLRAAQSAEILAGILEYGRDGDWLVVRGYKAADDLVATFTNTPLSHVAILDRRPKATRWGDGANF